MVDRYLEGLRFREPIHAGNVEPADEGPEGPPAHVSGGLTAGDRAA
jgi:glutamate synthase (NADPH/NADH) small chain